MTRARADVFYCGARSRTNVFYSRAGTFSDLPNRMTCARTDVFHGRAGAFSDLTYCVTRT